jgi:2-dehydro-3-deoxyphosphogluconate aldolase / (4S)-4-hydroxy-2-oxoglutarate aldolase
MKTYAVPSELEPILRTAAVIPVLTIHRLEDAVPLAKALVEGGLPVLEITLRTAFAIPAVRQIREAVPGAIVGVGTILTVQDLKVARAAGANFGVSPGLTPNLAAAVIADGIPFLPGVATASEIMLARAFGFQHLKFFPAEPMGGRDTLAALRGPFPDVIFCPTGGIRAEMLSDYLQLPNVACVGGSWLAPEDDKKTGAWGAISERAAIIGAGVG